MKRVRLRLEQINPTLGDLHTNLELHRRAIADAKRDGVELLVFPELSLTGYFLKDQTAELATDFESEILQELIGLSGDLSIVVGFVERDRGGSLHNTSAWLERGELRHAHRKVHLVSYGMFDEERDFAAGSEFRSFESRWGRFGILTCEDAWHMPGAYTYFLDEVDAIIVPSAGPGRGVAATDGPGLRSTRTWDRLLSSWSMLTQSWVVYANRVGFEDGIAFGGGSSVHAPGGRRAAHLDGLDTGRLDFTLDGADLRRARVTTPLRRDERPWLLADELAARTSDGTRR